MKERIILKLILRNYFMGHLIFIRGRRRTGLFCCAKVIGFLSSIKCEKFID
jgi:hypothetical protein